LQVVTDAISIATNTKARSKEAAMTYRCFTHIHPTYAEASHY